MKKNIALLTYVIFGFFLVVIDQFFKWKALHSLADGPYPVNSILSFNLVFNRGVSWGMFSSDNMLPFVLVTLLILFLTGLFFIAAYIGFLNHRCVAAEVMVIAGSISNLMDRFVHGAVVDFIHFSYKGWSWPIFNLADCFIVIGILLVIINQYRD